MSRSYQTLVIEIDQTWPVAFLKLNRVAKANSMNAQMIEELTQALEELAKLPDTVQLVLLDSVSSKYFCAGADLEWMRQSVDLNRKENVEDARKLAHMFRTLAEMPQITIATVEGVVYGGGLGLVSACDLAFCLDRTAFCLSELKIGLIPAVIYPFLKRRCHPNLLFKYSLLSEKFVGPEAKDLGLVDGVFANSKDLRSHVNQVAKRLLNTSPQTKLAFKKLRADLYPIAEAELEICCQAIAERRTEEDAQQSLQAFLNKEPNPHRLVEDERFDLWLES